MAFSIVASDGVGLGAAVASEFIAVGAVVPHAKAGAVAIQCHADPRLGEVVLGHLAAGTDAEPALRRALEGTQAGRKDGQASWTSSGGPPRTLAPDARSMPAVGWRRLRGASLGGADKEGRQDVAVVYGEGSEAVREREGVDKGPWSSS